MGRYTGQKEIADPRSIAMVRTETRPTKILLVDDHPLLRKGIRSVLEQYRELYIVGEASNGLEAVLYARTLQPDVIVMDINMPEMDGVQATRQIRQEFPGVKIIGLSVNDSGVVKDALLQAGAVAYLNKENVGEDLYGTISEYLN
jgi:DNA-binding NarL/FixJ family response regulator